MRKGHAQLLTRWKGLQRGSICGAIDWDLSAAEPGGGVGVPQQGRGPSVVQRSFAGVGVFLQVSVAMRPRETD